MRLYIFLTFLRDDQTNRSFPFTKIKGLVGVLLYLKKD
jgi:hypothetical protein